ncbi:hypothetical protein L7F22_045295 [Adiantum nelumboides]|nr:hypothetical protein [Adiantum nelumboides]
MPSSIVSDRDVQFTEHFWTQIFTKLNVKLNMSSGDHPQTDGQQTERVNQVLEDMLRAYVSDMQTNWDTYLPLLEFAYNNRPNRVTGLSPYEMNYDMSPLARGSLKLVTSSVLVLVTDLCKLVSTQDNSQNWLVLVETALETETVLESETVQDIFL